MTVRVLAYAKLNLFLAILGKRDDGFHEIESLVQTIDLADQIEVSLASTVTVNCEPRLAGINIAETAARALLQEKKAQRGVHIRIEKRIPMGAGLGGGSSDAAAILTVVNRLIPPRVSDSRLADIAASIGADVPLFLTGGCVSLAGVGRPEEQHPIRLETFVLHVPYVHCATKDVYSAWVSEDAGEGQPALGRNDLAASAEKIYPELAAVGETMNNLGGDYSGMTGSGAAYFAAFADPTRARLAYEALARQQPGSRVYYCQPTKVGSLVVSGDSGIAKTRSSGLAQGDRG